MKSKLLLFIGFIICACTNPDKVNTTGADSLTNSRDSTILEPVLSDTLTFDSLTALVGFNPNDSQSYFVLTNYLTDSTAVPPATDVQLIDSTCAVIIYPTDDQLQTMQTENADNFMALADTYSYYQGSAIEMLDSIDIETISAEKRFLTFKSRMVKNKKYIRWHVDIRKEGAPAWNLIFFNVYKEPQIISITDLSRELVTKYFDKKLE